MKTRTIATILIVAGAAGGAYWWLKKSPAADAASAPMAAGSAPGGASAPAGGARGGPQTVGIALAVTAIDGDEARDLLLSREASEANIAGLRGYIERQAPLAVPLLTDSDYLDFVDRDPFGGAVVRCPRVNVDEWLVLLGDSAHSVIPPTGEGVNSGLEDAALLADHLASGSATPLADYNAARLPDLEALGEYAWQLKDNLASSDPTRSATNVVLRILGAIGARFGFRNSQVEERLFGPHGGLTPYREAIGPWIAFQNRWTPPVRRAVTAVRKLTRRG